MAFIIKGIKEIKRLEKKIKGIEGTSAKIMRMAINTTVRRTVGWTVKEIRQHRRLKLKLIRDRLVDEKFASGKRIKDLEGSVEVNNKPIGLYQFVLGSKQVTSSRNSKRKTKRGKKIKSKGVRYAVKPGVKHHSRSAFIAPGKKASGPFRGPNRRHVFRLGKSKGGRQVMQRQAVSNTARLFDKQHKGRLEAIDKRASRFLEKEVTRLLNLNLKKLGIN